jgi:hypothetical protein
VKIGTIFLARSLAILVIAITLAQAAEQAKPGADTKPADDTPPVGKAPLLLLENFETTAPGHIPTGFQKTGSVEVVEDVYHTGHRSLRINPATNGARLITMKGNILKMLGGQHWGRLYYKVQQPSPEPASGVIHSTLVAGSATSPAHKDHIEIRLLGNVMGAKGMFSYLYNVQPPGRAEFGKGTPNTYKFADEWTLAEWYVDFASQTYRLFIDGDELKEASFSKGTGNFEGAEIPEAFDSLSFGWTNYQAAGKGFTAWIDDIALSKERIGTRGILPNKASAKKP